LLLHYCKGKIKNRRNLKLSAWQCNIPNPLSVSIQEITLCLKACKRECALYQEHGKRFRQKHLENSKRIAKEQDDITRFVLLSKANSSKTSGRS
jgi:hypothetical protein